MYHLLVLLGKLSVSKNQLQIFCDNILISKLFFSKIMNKKRVSKDHPIQNFFEIYNPDMSDNFWNIYDIMNKSPYEVATVFYNLYKDNLTLSCIRHTALEILNLTIT